MNFGVEPRLGHQTGSGRRADLLGELGEEAVFLGGEDALLDAQLAQRDLQDLEVGDLVDHRLDGPVVVVVVVVVVTVVRQCAILSRGA